MSGASSGLGQTRLSGGPPDAARSAAPGASALPCLNSNISNETALAGDVLARLNRLSTNHRKTAFKLVKSVARLVARYGVERIGFLTLSFPEHVTCAKEAGRRFNSLRTGVLVERYAESICVLERMQSGRIHFHLLVVVAVDIRTGFDFEEAARRVYRSANAALRCEWSFWRSITNYDGKHPEHSYAIFGRTELMPVKSNEEGLSKYLGKYIGKHVGARQQRDNGVRLVRYSRGASIGSNAFMFWSVRSRLWLWQVSQFAALNGCAELADLREKFGARWAYQQRGKIMAIEPAKPSTSVRVGEECIQEPLDMWGLWAGERLKLAAAMREATGCQLSDAWTVLQEPGKRVSLEFEVPRWSGQKVNTAVAEVRTDVTICWKGGRIERTPAKTPANVHGSAHVRLDVAQGECTRVHV